MKFIPILLIVLLVLLCATGIGQISAAELSCFGSDCHVSVDMGTIEPATDHSKLLFKTCSDSCHVSNCDELTAYIIKMQTIEEMEEAAGSAGSSSNSGREVQLFSDSDTATVWQIIRDSGIGIIFAAISIFYNISLIIVPILMCAVIAICVMLNKTEAHRDLLKGIGIIIVVVILLKLYISFVSHATPDLSTISF